MTHLKPTDSIGSSKSFTSLEIFGPMARDIIATHANTIGSTVTAFCRLAQCIIMIKINNKYNA